MQWYDHNRRMDEDTLVRTVLGGSPEGRKITEEMERQSTSIKQKNKRYIYLT